MDAIHRQGACGGGRVGAKVPSTVPARLLAACGLLLLAAWAAAPADASVLYRCVGSAGEVAYVSHTTGLKHCTRIGAWPSAHARKVADRRAAKAPEPAKAVPGKPPRPAKADPAVLKVVPLGDEDSIEVSKLERPHVWRPLPVEILDALGDKLLPQLLGVEPPAPSASPAQAPQPSVPEPPAADPIPLKLAAAPKPKPPRKGSVYRVTLKDGTVLYTNVASLTRGGDSKVLFSYIISCYACNVHSRIDWNTVPLQLAAYGDDIRAAAKASGVDAALLRAVIHAESGFNARALSYKGAQGLMQLMPGTAFELGVDNAFDPAENISGGARYLAMLLRNYHGDVRLAAAAYNAGAGAVQRYGGVPPYAETEVYVKRVALLYQRYARALAARGGGSGTTLVAAGLR